MPLHLHLLRSSCSDLTNFPLFSGVKIRSGCRAPPVVGLLKALPRLLLIYQLNLPAVAAARRGYQCLGIDSGLHVAMIFSRLLLRFFTLATRLLSAGSPWCGPSISPWQQRSISALTASSSAVPVETMWDAFQRAKNVQIQRWIHIALGAQLYSIFIQDLLKSPLAHEHIARMVAMNAPSTLASYFAAWNHWQKFCEVQAVIAFEPAVEFLADFLHLHTKGRLGSALSMVKALRFVASRLVLSALRETLASPLVMAYTRTTTITERRETAPLPLSFVIWLENQVLADVTSPRQILWCGMLLVCIFASLRWSDALWSAPQRLQCARNALLGAARRTKTTNRTMPFGALAGGFLARPVGASGWGQKFLHHLQTAVQRTRLLHPGFQPDFLVAELGEDPQAPVLLAPLTRQAGLVLIRSLLSDCYSSVPARDRPDFSLIGVHSLKGTFLAFAKQLLLDDNLRRLQGHHRVPGMSELYGRDDVLGPLELQVKIVNAVATGFQPLRPAMRGAAPPKADIAVTVPPIEDECDAPPIPALGRLPGPTMEMDSSSDSEDEKVQAPAVESVSEEPASAWRVQSTGSVVENDDPDEFEFLYNATSKIVHVARPCAVDHPACQYRPVQESAEDRPLRPGCSCRGNLTLGALHRVDAIPQGARMCLKHGCGKDPAIARLAASPSVVPCGTG